LVVVKDHNVHRHYCALPEGVYGLINSNFEHQNAPHKWQQRCQVINGARSACF